MGKQEYSTLSQQEPGSPYSDETWQEPLQDYRPRKPSRTWTYGLIGILILGNIVQLGLWHFGAQPSPSDERRPSNYAIPHELPVEYRPFYWNTEYSGGNQSLADDLWDAILPSHGFVAMDRDWAAAQHWPETMYLPEDPSKGVYLLEAYHQLHCLKILRTTMRESLAGAAFTYHPGHHMEHCFGYLLQTTMCHADTTPLYTFGDNTAGHGQVHQCRDWAALRTFATEHKACYRDTIADVLLREHFGYCDDGDDGLIIGTDQGTVTD